MAKEYLTLQTLGLTGLSPEQEEIFQVWRDSKVRATQRNYEYGLDRIARVLGHGSIADLVFWFQKASDEDLLEAKDGLMETVASTEVLDTTVRTTLRLLVALDLRDSIPDNLWTIEYGDPNRVKGFFLRFFQADITRKVLIDLPPFAEFPRGVWEITSEEFRSICRHMALKRPQTFKTPKDVARVLDERGSLRAALPWSESVAFVLGDKEPVCYIDCILS